MDGAGSPRGFQAINTKIAATKRIDPKPPKRYVRVLWNHLDGGGDGWLGPTSFSFCAAAAVLRPVPRELE